MLEMRLLIATFVWHFDAELVRKEEPLYLNKFIVQRGSLEVRLKQVNKV